MAGEFKRLVLKQFPPTTETETVENAYWKKFQSPQELQQVGPVTHIDVSPAAPHHVAVTSSTRIHLYSTTSNAIVKTFSRFRNVVYSGTFRSDGKLLVAGGEDPTVHVLDIATRALLRTFKGHHWRDPPHGVLDRQRARALVLGRQDCAVLGPADGQASRAAR
ncbi:hypothetical protein PINS_up022502 [Pythium insidiosum]|nr:hypothetical protein PINS_up022502 [Pythium insidiosum]